MGLVRLGWARSYFGPVEKQVLKSGKFKVLLLFKGSRARDIKATWA